MKQWSRIAADILAFVMIWFLCSISALAAGTPQAEKAARANELLAACLKEHPEYVSAICFDLDGNGVNEMLASETENMPTRATLYALSNDGKRLLSWRLFSRFSSFAYDSSNRTLTTDSSGTGVNEFCTMSLSGNDLVVRHIGKNLEFHDLGDRYYDYSEIVSGLSGDYVRYSFGQIASSNGTISPDWSILQDCEISGTDYEAWHDYYSHIRTLEFQSAAEVMRQLSGNISASQIVQVSSGGYHTLALTADGIVLSTGSDRDGQRNTRGWDHVSKISAGIEHTVALRRDGTVYAAGRNTEGQCNVGNWRDIVDIDAQHWHTIGLKADGTVVAAGTESYGATDVNGFRNIVAVSAGEYHNLLLDGSGKVHASGSNLYGESDVSGWSDIMAVDAGYNHSVGLRSDGTVVAVGLNSSGQCDVTEWNNIIAISGGGKQTVGLRSDGTVIAVGSNEFGQCNVSDWRNVVWISAGYSATIAVTAGGEVLATGWNEYGQCRVDELTSG